MTWKYEVQVINHMMLVPVDEYGMCNSVPVFSPRGRSG
jgi:hypothetical protein